MDETEGVLGRDTGRESDRTGVDGVERERDGEGEDELVIVIVEPLVDEGSSSILRILSAAVNR